MSGFWKVFLTAFISTVIVGGITFYFMNQKLTADNKDKDTKISGLTKQVADLSATSTTSTSSTTSTTTTTDTTAGWKTYANTAYGFSFEYPSTLTLTDTLNQSGNWNAGKKVIVKDSTNSIEIWINPDGFGPFFPDKSYLLGKSGSGIKISETTIGTDENSKTDGQYMVIATYESNTGIIPYFIAKNTENKESIDSLFKQILSTFQFTK